MESPRKFFEQVPLEMIREGIRRGEIVPPDGAVDVPPEGDDQLRYPLWQVPLQEALLEFDPEKLPERIALAEVTIRQRLETLVQDRNAGVEHQALRDALATLRVLKT